MQKLILGLSWLNGRFKAVALNKGIITGQWECPQLVGPADALKPILQEAIQQTHYTGYLAAMVLVHPQLTMQLIEAPPVEGRDLVAFIQRRAQQVNPFAEKTTWSYQKAEPTKGAMGVLLHLLPQQILNELVRSCQEVNLHLVKLFSPNALLAGQLAHLPLKPGETTLLAAETEGSIAVLVGRGKGDILTGRSFRCTWQKDIEYATAEIKRVTLFTKQRFDTSVESAWLLDPIAQDHLAHLQRNLDFPVQICAKPPGPFFWVQEACAQPHATSANLITKEMQKAPQQRIFIRITSILVGFLMACCIAVAAFVEFQVHKRSQERDRLKPELQELLLKKQQIDLPHADLARRQGFIDFMEKTVPPVAGWFLQYVSGGFEQLVVTDFRVELLDPRQGLWQLRLAGFVQPADGEPVPGAVVKTLQALESRLQSGPFHVTITESTLRALSAGTSVGSSNLSSLNATPETTFFINGIMRVGTIDPKKPQGTALVKGLAP